MELPLLLVLVVTTVTASQKASKDIETVYTGGKEYIYKYESQILSGLPLGSKIYSGLKIKGFIVLQKVTNLQMKMEMRDPRIYKVNGPLLQNDPTREIIPDEVMTELLDDDAEKMKSYLIKPVMFQYEHGHVENLVVEHDDSEWSVNIKKAPLSLLEVNFNDRHSLSPQVDAANAEVLPKIYRVVEPSIFGECETIYKLKIERSRDGDPSMDIVKMRDLNKCLDKVILQSSMLNESPCEKAEDILSAQSSVRYSLLGSPGQYIILSAVGESQYNMVPHHETAGRVSTLANQTLFLIDSRPITIQIEDPKMPKDQESPLTAMTSEQTRQQLFSQTLDTDPKEQDELVKMVEKALVGIDELMMDYVKDEVSDLLKDLHLLLGKLDKPIIKAIISKMERSSHTMPRARKVLLDVLPAVGSHASIDVVLERIENGKETSQSAITSLILIGLHPNPDVAIMKRVMSSVKASDKMEPLVKRSAWLCLGALGHKLLKKNSSEIEAMISQEKTLKLLLEESNEMQLRSKLREKLDKIKETIKQTEELYKTAKESIKEMVEKLYNKKDDKEAKLLALKVMQALKYPDFQDQLKSIAMHKDSPAIHRMEAVVGLKELAKTQPEKIQKILLPLFFDRSDEEEIRSLAVLVSLMSGLPRSEVEMVAKSVLDEPSSHVSSLVASALILLSNISDSCSCAKSLSFNSTLASRLAQLQKPGMHSSNIIHMSSYSDELRMGQVYEQAILYSSKEKLPRAVSMQLSSYSKKSLIRVLEVGYKARGLDGVLDRVLEDSSLGAVSALVRKLLHPRLRRSTSETEQQIKTIKEKLEVKPRVSEPLEGHMFIRLYGQELIYLDLPDLLPQSSEQQDDQSFSLLESLEGKVDSLLPDISGILESLKKLLNSQQSIVLPLEKSSLPTDTGIPLLLGSKVTAALKLDGNLKLQLDPSIPMKKSIISKFDSILDIKISAVLENTVDMKTKLETIQSGIAMKSKVSLKAPVSVSINMDPEKEKLLVKITDQKKLEPVSIEMKPVTFIKHLARDAAHYPSPAEEQELSLLDKAELKTISYSVGESVLGRKLSVVGVKSVRRDTGMTHPLMSGKQLLHVVYDPLSKPDIDIQVQHVTEKPVTEDHGESSSKSKSSWWPFSWLKTSSDISPPEYKPEEAGEGKTDYDPVKGFINIEKEDLSITYLKGKFSKDTEILKSGQKHGLVIRMADPDPIPMHEIQLSTLLQSDKSAYKYLYAVELRRKPILDEKNDWKIITTMKVELPEMEIEPSDLQDNIYQQEIERHLKQAISDSDKAIDSVVELKSKILTKAMAQINEQDTERSLDKLLEDVISYVMEKEIDVSLKEFTKLVQKQRKITKDIDRFVKQPIKPNKKGKYFKKINQLVEESNSVSSKVMQKLGKIVSGKERPEEALLSLYIISSKKVSSQNLKHILQKLHPILSLDEEIDTYRSLSELVKNQLKLKTIQDQHSLAKQATELNKATLEIDPDDRDIYRHLLKVEKDIISVVVPRKKENDEIGVKNARLQLNKQLEDLLKESQSIIDKLDKKLEHGAKISKMLQMKMIEILLHKKVILSDVENSKLMENEEEIHSSSPSTKPNYVELKQLIKRNSKKMLKRLVFAVDTDREDKSLVSLITPNEQDDLNSLQKLKLKQQIVLEKISEAAQDQYSGKVSFDILKDSVKRANDISKEVKQILEPFLEDNKKYELSPVVVKALHILSRQSPIIDKTISELKKEVIDKSTKQDPDSSEALKLLSDLKELKFDVIKQLEKLEKSYLETNQDDSKSSLSLSALLKKSAELEVKELKLKTLSHDVLEELDKAVSPLPQSGDRIKRKKFLYDAISLASDIQSDIESLRERINGRVSSSPNDKSTEDLINLIEKKQTEQLETVERVETKVKKMASSDPALSLPLQHLQQLKDKALRHQLEIKKVKEEQKQPVDQPSSLQTQPNNRAASDVEGLLKPLKATAIVSYGPVDEKPKNIHILLLGKKSMDQLLWEKEQNLPDRQDRLVKLYLQDKATKDDRVAVGYDAIKQGLNTYRHLHMFVSYEDSLPVGVRALSWKMHELIKLIYYKKVSLFMPDKTNLHNKLNIKVEMNRDDRWVDVEIKSPQETTILKNLELPALCKLAALPRGHTAKEQLIQAMIGTSSQATCAVSADRIKTLQDSRYEIDPSIHECEKVLAIDCGLSDKLAVTSRPSPQQPGKKILKIITSHHKIELSPIQTDIEVTVDDVKQDLNGHPVVKDKVAAYKLKDGSVKISLPSLGVVVTTNGEESSIEVSKVHSPKICGLCGERLAGLDKEMRDPHKVAILEPLPFQSTYLLSSPQCDPKVEQARLQVSSIRKESKLVKPLEKTMVMIQKKRDKVCFSKTGVKACPFNSHPEGTEAILVPFHCLRSSDPKVPAYLAIAERHIIDEIRYKPVSVNEYVSQPKICISE